MRIKMCIKYCANRECNKFSQFSRYHSIVKLKRREKNFLIRLLIMESVTKRANNNRNKYHLLIADDCVNCGLHGKHWIRAMDRIFIFLFSFLDFSFTRQLVSSEWYCCPIVDLFVSISIINIEHNNESTCNNDNNSSNGTL